MPLPQRENIMLAHPPSKRRMEHLGEKVFSQPKLNGDRFRTHWFHGEPCLLSSYGNELKWMDHIILAMKKIKDKTGIEFPFDGEIYVHGWDHERIHSAFSRKTNYSPDVVNLEAHIFDLQLFDKQQWQRTKILHELADIIPKTSPIKIVKSIPIVTEDYQAQTAAYLADGYEGGMYRSLTGMYVIKRTADLIKHKPTEKDEYLIVDCLEGKGRLTGMLGAFLVKAVDHATTFKVGTGMTDDQRKRYWAERTRLPGQLLEVKHETLRTRADIPVSCRVVQVKYNYA